VLTEERDRLYRLDWWTIAILKSILCYVTSFNWIGGPLPFKEAFCAMLQVSIGLVDHCRLKKHFVLCYKFQLKTNLKLIERE